MITFLFKKNLPGNLENTVEDDEEHLSNMFKCKF